MTFSVYSDHSENWKQKKKTASSWKVTAEGGMELVSLDNKSGYTRINYQKTAQAKF
uniref:Alternative protein RAD23B n=1 Tax=Homo sapiens TaxID=9606 RepID=L8EA19_HUMAN|nr:alternative protein RAD23B [Homo sapiens]